MICWLVPQYKSCTNIIPVKMVEKGTSCPGSPVESNLSGLAETNASKPSKTLPSPMAISPKTGIKTPPTINPIALILSETTTAFNPPKTAYIEPMIPIPHMQMTKAVLSETSKSMGTSNIPLIATDPEYRMTGKSTTTYPVRNRPEVMVLVATSKRRAKNWGTVVRPSFRYLGNKNMAVTTMAMAARVSQAITDNPSL